MSWLHKPYVPVAERRANAEKKMRALAKKGQKIEPVEIVHRSKIAGSFWGRAWCDHLESYSDYANRLPRGRTYARNGSVVHLRIERGRIEALVSGSSLYQIGIRIDPLPAKKWETLKKRCQGQIGSLIELLQGKISGEIMAIVTDRKEGLFPAPKEIRTDCNCPDWAGLCKHLAAVLYGVGARLDAAPELLFTLRGIDQAELIAAGAKDLTNPAKPGGRRRVLASTALEDVFEIDLDETDTLAVAEEAPPLRKSATPAIKTAPPPVADKPVSRKRPSSRKATVKSAPKTNGRRRPAAKPAKPAPKMVASEPATRRGGAGTFTFRPTPAAIRALREDLGLTRAAFAAAIGVTSATVGNWENVKAPVKPQLRAVAALRRLARKRDGK